MDKLVEVTGADASDREWAIGTYNRLARIHSRVNCTWEHTNYLAAEVARYRHARLASNPTDAARIEERVREQLINTPETADFIAGIALEAAHQRERWAVDHDAGKSPFDWFWLIGYLGQKAADAATRGDAVKAMHHTISTAAALGNWHAALAGIDTRMRPGIGPGNGGEKPGSAYDLASALPAPPAAPCDGGVCPHGIRSPWQCDDCDRENPMPKGWKP